MNRKLGLRVSSKRAHRALSRLFGPPRPSSTCPCALYQTVSEEEFSGSGLPAYPFLGNQSTYSINKRARVSSPWLPPSVLLTSRAASSGAHHSTQGISTRR